MDLQSTWFVLLFVLLAGYAVLDGFDLGVGVLHLLGRDDRERRISLNSIGPVWDGNEVWLLTAGGALFAAFPAVYATVFSGFYIALMLLLAALIGRAVAMEFRSKVESPSWRRVWDVVFSVGSILPPVLLGVAFGNILRGVPIDSAGNFTGSFLGLLNPYSILIGLLTLVLFTLHGAIYLAQKSGEPMRDRLMAMLPKLWLAMVILYVLATAASLLVSPSRFKSAIGSPLTWVFLPVAILSLAAVGVLGRRGQAGVAFLASSLTILSMVGLAAVSLYPKLVPSSIDPSHSLTIFNSSSSQKTLRVMFIIALMGVPAVLLYSALVYRVFRGKVVLGEHSY